MSLARQIEVANHRVWSQLKVKYRPSSKNAAENWALGQFIKAIITKFGRFDPALIRRYMKATDKRLNTYALNPTGKDYEVFSESLIMIHEDYESRVVGYMDMEMGEVRFVYSARSKLIPQLKVVSHYTLSMLETVN